MDTTLSASDIARELGTSLPRVIRAAHRLRFDDRAGRGHLRLSPEQRDRLRDELGKSVPVPGYSQIEVAALAALSRAPLGLPSARAVARRAGMSPTAASRAVASLRERGLVRQEQRDIVAGRTRHVVMLYANWRHPAYASLSQQVRRVEPPASSRDARVPARLTHLFWNTKPDQLEVQRGGPYIARRLLRTLDPAGLSWGAENLRSEDWREAAKARGLAPSVRALAENLAAGSGR